MVTENVTNEGVAEINDRLVVDMFIYDIESVEEH